MNASTTLEPLRGETAIQNDPDAPRILEQFQLARKANRTLVFHAVIAGQMMIEKKAQLHQAFERKNRYKPDDAKFDNWLENNCPDILRRTAYRWMLAAHRVFAHLLKSSLEEPEVCVGVNGQQYYISVVLTRPEAECAPEMLAFRANFQNYLEVKTLIEATSAVMLAQTMNRASPALPMGKRMAGTSTKPKRISLILSAINFTIFQSI